MEASKKAGKKAVTSRLTEYLSSQPNQKSILDILDLSGAWDSTSMLEILIDDVKKRGLNPREFVYSSFSLRDLGRLLDTGSYSKSKRDIVFCSTYDELFGEESGNIIRYAQDHKTAGIIVYNPEFLIENNGIPYEYRIKPDTNIGDLIKVIYRIKWK
ncbi:MAG: hypothetical protein ABR981_01765 [Candidatus Micrarchaeaceae archaeon]|jgi:hypothetical protein